MADSQMVTGTTETERQTVQASQRSASRQSTEPFII